MRGIKRIMRLLLVGLFSIIIFCLELATKVYSVVISWFYIVLAICVVVALLWKQWTSVVILVSAFIMSIGVVFFIGLVIAFFEIIKEQLLCKRL